MAVEKIVPQRSGYKPATVKQVRLPRGYQKATPSPNLFRLNRNRFFELPWLHGIFILIKSKRV
jgi:hypothetical protein